MYLNKFSYIISNVFPVTEGKIMFKCFAGLDSGCYFSNCSEQPQALIAVQKVSSQSPGLISLRIPGHIPSCPIGL